MNIRTQLINQYKKYKILGFIGFVIMGTGIVLMKIISEKYYYVSAFGFGLASFCFMYGNFKNKCPKCSTILGDIEDKKIKYCPGCGVNLDEEFSKKST